MVMSRLATRFALAGLTVFLFMCGCLSWLAISQLRDTALEEAQARANLVAEEMADQVQLAVNAGVPVNRLVGVEELFELRMASFPGIARATLLDDEGNVLHERRTSTENALKPASILIISEGARVAELELQWGQPSISALLLPWGVPLFALFAVTMGLAGEALRFGLTGLVLRRERLVVASCSRIASGDLSTRAPRLGRHDFDNRIPWLSEQLRHIGEQHMRVERLAQSLRQTEPDFDKRRHIDQVLATALGQDQFAAPTRAAFPKDRMNSARGVSFRARPMAFSEAVSAFPPSSQAALLRWRGIMLGVLAWAAPAIVAGQHFAWVGFIALVALALVLGLARRWEWWTGTKSGWFGVVLGGLVFGPCLSLLTQMAWAPQHFLALGKLGYGLLLALSLLALILPWFNKETMEPLSVGNTHAA